MSFSSQAWEKNVDRYQAIRTMPFNSELAAGTLGRGPFAHYIVQDAHYLIGFGRALAISAARAPHPDRVVQFARAADFDAAEPTPACQHYVSYLLAAAYGEDHAVGLAALLPCFWIYAEIGRDILARAATPNPYQAWIDTYAGEDFHQAVAAMIAATDEAAALAAPATVQRMHAAFTAATRLEYLFWRSAHEEAAWPL